MWPDELMPERFPKPSKITQTLSGKFQRETKFDGFRGLLCNADASALDGELWWPGHHATDVKHALVTDPSVLVYSPWAVLWWEGRDYRREQLCENRERLVVDFSRFYSDSSYILSSHRGKNSGMLPVLVGMKRTILIRLETVIVKEVDLEDDLRIAREEGLEGWVYKDPSQPWGEGWWKAKVSETVDCAVIGIVRGNVGVTGQFEDLVGSLILGLKDMGGQWVEVGCTSGMTLQERQDFSTMFQQTLSMCKNPGDRWTTGAPIMDGCVEVRFDEVASQGRLKMPRFVRTRDDKKAEDCLLSQLSGKRGAKLPKEILDAFGKVDRIRAERRQAAAQRGAETRSASGGGGQRESIE